MSAARIGRIIVGVDGSKYTRSALEWAVLLARRFDAEVVAVHAVGLLTHLAPQSQPVPSHTHLAELRRVFESQWCAPLEQSGVTHRMLCLDGSPARVVLDTAEAEAADLIVLGSRGAGGFAELRLGSTSHQVAEHSHLPVLIVPPGRDLRGIGASTSETAGFLRATTTPPLANLARRKHLGIGEDGRGNRQFRHP
ncbi:MAG: universal stress protein [Acidimicrobiales bacterium]